MVNYNDIENVIEKTGRRFKFKPRNDDDKEFIKKWFSDTDCDYSIEEFRVGETQSGFHDMIIIYPSSSYNIESDCLIISQDQKVDNLDGDLIKLLSLIS